MTSHDVALQIMQEAVKILADWTEVDLPEFQSVEPKQQQAINNAKKHLNWPKNQKEPQPLRLLFDLVDFSEDGKDKDRTKALQSCGCDRRC